MDKSKNITELYRCIAKVQEELKDPRKEDERISLETLFTAVSPVLRKNALCYTQVVAGDGQHVAVTTTLMHDNGQFIESNPLILRPKRTDLTTIDDYVNYGRYCSLSTLLGIAWGRYAIPGPTAADELEKQKLSILKELSHKAKSSKMSGEDIKNIILFKFQGQSSADLTIEQCNDLHHNYLKYWKEYLDAQKTEAKA